MHNHRPSFLFRTFVCAAAAALPRRAAVPSRRAAFAFPSAHSFRAVLAATFVLAFIFALVPVSALAQPNHSPDFDPPWLVRDGVFRGKIFLPAQPAPEERAAAATLAHWIQKITDASPEIATEPPDSAFAPPPGLYIGNTALAAARRIAPPARAGETWLWRPVGTGALCLLGNTPLATRLAAGEFLQRHFDITFLLPGEWGAEWTPSRAIRMPAAGQITIPGYKWRNLTTNNPTTPSTSASSAPAETPAVRDWMRNNGLGEHPTFAGGLDAAFDPAVLRARPEFQPTLNAQRRLDSGAALAAPGAATHAAHRAAAFFLAHPTAPAFPLGPAPGQPPSGARDESHATRSLAPLEAQFDGLPDYSNYFFVFLNRVATALWPKPAPAKDQPRWDASRWSDPVANPTNISDNTPASSAANNSSAANPAAAALPIGIPTAAAHPAASSAPAAPPPEKFLACAVGFTCSRLPDFPLHPNILPVLCADRSRWNDPTFRLRDAARIRQWAHSGARHFGIMDTGLDRPAPVPRVYFDEQIDSIRHGVESGASLYSTGGQLDWGFDAPAAWLAARLTLYPGQLSALLLNHFFNEAYGPASAHMRDFFDLAAACRTTANSAANPNSTNLVNPTNPNLVNSVNPAATVNHPAIATANAADITISPAAQAQMRTALDRAEAAFPGTFWPTRQNTAMPSATAAAHRANERLARQQIRVRMTSLAFAVTERHLALQRHLATTNANAAAPVAIGFPTVSNATAPVKTPPADSTANTLHRELEQARELWQKSEINPAAPNPAPTN
jgi:hypothetical protein